MVHPQLQLWLVCTMANRQTHRCSLASVLKRITLAYRLLTRLIKRCRLVNLSFDRPLKLHSVHARHPSQVASALSLCYFNGGPPRPVSNMSNTANAQCPL